MSISSTNPGPCLNSNCSAQPCGMFIPVDDDPLTALLRKCCACGCLGVQHYKSNAGNEPLDSAAPKPSMSASNSKMADFAFTPPPSGAYEHLKACTKDHKVQVNAAWVDGMNAGYDPAVKVYQKVLEQLQE
ncbi:hypothetical protein K439DRAFT_1612757 [Ramaria rubella]|nr:hypothetical protein K439DRAFT_1612757 [Ramaria rubella]